jgi:hypothetical protein
MAVQVAQEQRGGLLGGLGTLLSVGGTLMGVPLMSTIGMGLSAVNAIASGNPMGAAEAVMGMKDTGMLGSWKNPAAGKLHTPGGAVTQLAAPFVGDEDEYKRYLSSRRY